MLRYTEVQRVRQTRNLDEHKDKKTLTSLHLPGESYVLTTDNV